MERKVRDSGKERRREPPQALAPRGLPGPPAESECPDVPINVQIVQSGTSLNGRSFILYDDFFCRKMDSQIL
ncbi:hypothetical protein RCO48_25070 [Peribacillus frigoritolerans]|nr:hypothetical protein [Peribacillus frigoritolerans]